MSNCLNNIQSLIYWFDSHSQDEHGLSVVCGTSVLLKFRNLSEVEKYIHIAYLEYRDIQRLYFQIQFLRVNLSSAEISNTYSQYRFSIRRSNYQKNASVVNRKRRERYTTHTIGTEKHEKVKKKKRFDSCRNCQNSKYSSNQDLKKDKSCLWKNQVLTLKHQITEGSYFVCVVCNRCLYRRLVIIFENKKYEVDSCVYFYVE